MTDSTKSNVGGGYRVVSVTLFLRLFAGNLICHRLVGSEPQRMLILLAVLLAVTDGLFGDARTGIATSTALFASAAFVAGGRSILARAFAVATAPEIRPAVTGLRAAAMQFGYFGRLDRRRCGALRRRLRRPGVIMRAHSSSARCDAGPPSGFARRIRRRASRVPARVRCYRLFTERAGDQQPARGPLRLI
jgi:hypothetical protein